MTARPDFLRGFAERWVDAWNSHEPDRILELCTADVHWHDPVLPEPVRGHDAVREFLVSTWRGFPDLTFTPIGAPYATLDEDAAALQWSVRGTMLGPIEPPGLAPTGAVVEGVGVDLYRFRGDLLEAYSTVYDLSTWMRAMGLLPEPGGRAERVGVVFQRLGARRARRRNRAATTA
jgi:steroid delta-isomerase-like uncharacterized protein